MCEALSETGYRFCRVAYRPGGTRLLEAIRGARADSPSEIECIAGMYCVRLNTPGGFCDPVPKMMERCRGGRYVVVYGHPHSITSGNSQDLKYLVPFFERAKELRAAGQLEVVRPKDVLSGIVEQRRTELLA